MKGLNGKTAIISGGATLIGISFWASVRHNRRERAGQLSPSH